MDGKTPIMRERLEAEGLSEIGERILKDARNELYLNMRFLDVALSSLVITPDFGIGTLATDGQRYVFHPEYLGRLYRTGRAYVNHAYLHSILHCLFCHMYVRGKREEALWNLSCDIAIESVIDSLYKPCVHVSRSPVRREFYQRLEEALKVRNAQAVYHYLEGAQLGKARLMRLAADFYVDDHSLWQGDQDRSRPNPRKQQWEDVRNRMETEMETFSKEASEDSQSLLTQVQIENRERYDYRGFLRKFSVFKETVKVDPDSFDYIYYDYGLRTYGNMPLIEPLETKEVKGIEDFVIVIDTSMSCSGELVRRFLEETYTVLGEAESFFNKVNIHLIQCDEKVQHDQKITSGKELKAYMDHMEIRGQGGTDFRPAFQYVDQLMAAGSFDKLKGLLYFTDGYGVFPTRMPPYDTAFVFMKDDYRDVDVPPWAIKIILDPEQLGNVEER